MELFTRILAFIVLQVGPMYCTSLPLGTLYYCPLHYRMYYLNVIEIFCDLEKAVINQMILRNLLRNCLIQ